MKSCFKHLFVFFLVAAPMLAATAEEAKTFQAVLDNYAAAMKKQDGKEAVKHVSSESFAYYDKMIKLALDADSAAVAALPLIDKMNVITLRYYINREDLLKNNGKQIFQQMIDSKLKLAQLPFDQITLGKPKVNGKTASAPVTVQGMELPMSLEFVQEDGQWKLNIVEMMETAASSISQLMKMMGKTEDEFVSQFLEDGAKKAQNPVWHPVR